MKQKIKRGVIQIFVFLATLRILFLVLNWVFDDVITIGPILQITQMVCSVMILLISLIVTSLLTRGSKSMH
ncbi:hypothetical protein BVG16_18050 [Paenibacillus selenitireducens]|uniref:Uncharacterized protein n=1 Tax=Paenibacillus selenitireducens TaxID=1324314 RepID=A0A1T2X8D5_9BACL|nr:hypothetical protein BVG16_18050 [Paenibacillus selenitireducens]